MREFWAILLVATILWTTLILYVAYLDLKARSLSKKIAELEKSVKK